MIEIVNAHLLVYGPRILMIVKGIILFMVFSTLFLSSPLEAKTERVDRNQSIKNPPQQKKDLRRPGKGNLYGGTLVWGTVNAPTIINPILTQTSVSSSLMDLIFDSLVRINGEGKIVPGLATSWEVSSDQLEYTFHLKKRVFFHDGVELTAEDVKFTFDLINDPRNESPWQLINNPIKKVSVKDKYTVSILLNYPYSLILHKIRCEIVPKHLLENKDLKTAIFNHKPVGTGPFKFKEWDKATDQIELVANKDYFERRPYLDKIIVKTYEDSRRLWSAFMRNEIDLVKYISGDDYEIIKNDKTFKAYEIPWGMYLAIAYNLNDEILADKDIRKAIACSIDRKRIIESLSVGGIESIGPFHPDSLGFNPQVKAIDFKPGRAKKLLRQKEWRDIDNDGILERHGKDLVLKLLIDQNNSYFHKVVKMVRQQLAEVGIQLKLIVVRNPRKLDPAFIAEKEPQAWLRFFDGTGYDDYGESAAFNWYSQSKVFANLWEYRNVNVDYLIELSRETNDPKELSKIYQEIHQIIYEDQPACFLFFPMSYHAVSRKFKNTDELFSTNMPVYTIKDWYVAEKK